MTGDRANFVVMRAKSFSSLVIRATIWRLEQSWSLCMAISYHADGRQKALMRTDIDTERERGRQAS